MRALELVKSLPIEIPVNQDFEVAGITDNSKEVKENFIFVAIKGYAVNGEVYIEEAITKGAKLIISELILDTKIAISAQVKNPKEILGILLSKFYPDKPKNIVAVTGTNGKSSTVHFYKSIFQSLNQNSASIGTLGIFTNVAEFKQKENQITTPSLTELHQILHQLKSYKVDYVALEASSHGIHQDRLINIDFQAAAFTSLGTDHLDYHKSQEHYFNSKLKLFTKLLKKDTVAVINNDMEAGYLNVIYEKCNSNSLKIIKYGKRKDSDLRIIQINKTTKNQELTVKYQNQLYSTEISLIGEFQLFNMLAAIGLSLVAGLKFETIWAVIPKLTAAEGRMQEVQNEKLKGRVFIDYAHTADALEYILKDLRQYTAGKLKVLFGCGGGKDPNRRFSMGKVANDLADEVFITNDSPRDEDPAAIRKQIISSCPNSIEIPDRKEAIKYAVKSLKSGDILIITGKGHENYDIVNGRKTYFSDKEEVSNSL